ncbi:hypothetical protein CYCME_1293 [Cycloclasticus zancles 78-ME]|jgi:hypothetical protein|uniref:Uncharacterized protein n=1 Tax=Cycloclasticus zancles 78-ME TaxID=1198232 RepID=S5TFK3_9GAMM|nr:hypothetical protein CYCME_1293 [Cycloclasticus zancles 78-ME]
MVIEDIMTGTIKTLEQVMRKAGGDIYPLLIMPLSVSVR